MSDQPNVLIQEPRAPLRVDPDHEALIKLALDDLWSKAAAAKATTNTADAKARLNEVWFAVHRAQGVITEAEKCARDAALAKLEQAA